MHFPTKAATEVYIRRPDGTETRIVRPKQCRTGTRSDVVSQRRDEDREAVANCSPYTASFNALLKERSEKNTRVFVNAVLERMHAEAIPLNVVTYNLLMERVVCFSDELVFDLYEEMKEEVLKENGSVRPDLTTYQLLFRACERKGQYHRAFLLYKQMRELMHVVPDSLTYDILLGFCAAVRDVAQASYFFEEMKKNDVAPNVNTYNCLMNVLVYSAPYEETLQVFQQMIEEGIKPTIRSYNTVSKAACIHGDYDRAFQLFEEMKKRGILPDVVTYNTLFCLTEHRLDYYIKCGADNQAQRTYEQQKHGKKSIAELALILYSEMESMKVVPNTFTYNKLMTVLLKCGDYRVFQIYRTLQERYEAKKKKNLVSMTKCEKKEKLEMQRVGTALSNSYGTDSVGNDYIESMYGLKGVDIAESANISLDELMGKVDVRRPASITASEVRPNMDTYRIVVRACLELDLEDRCVYFYDKMLKEGIMPDYDMALLMQRVCEVTRDKTRALEVLKEAKKANLRVDTAFVNAYLKVIASQGDAQLITIFDELRLGISEFGVLPDVDTFNIMLYGYLYMEKYDSMNKLFASMYLSYSQATPNAETYCLMFQAYRRTRDILATEELFDSMKQRNIDIVVSHYHEIMRVYLECDDTRVVDLFYSLRNSTDKSAPRADAECFAIVMRYYLKKGKYSELEKLFDVLKADSCIELDDACYNVVLEMFAAQNRVADAKLLFTDLCMKCVPTSITTYNTLLRIFASAGDYTLFDVLNDMKMNHKAPASSTLGILLEYAEGRRAVSAAIESSLFWDPASALVGLC